MKTALIALNLAGLLLALPALASDEKREAPVKASPAATAAAKAPKAADPAAAAPRVLVAIDPATGELRAPTQEELRALEAGTRRALVHESEATTVETLPDGRKRARLGPEFFRWSVVKVNADGSLTFDCVPMNGLPSAPAAPAAPER